MNEKCLKNSQKVIQTAQYVQDLAESGYSGKTETIYCFSRKEPIYAKCFFALKYFGNINDKKVNYAINYYLFTKING